ncbi:MAG TPA: DUF2243 domain-containing protein [Anaerolineae bacterium]|nr:DUF2243 domain-containing protein [Anaerolineae bacterium]
MWNAAYRRGAIPSLARFGGQLLLGWGLFNLVEGVVDHHLLAIHYVRQVPNYMVYNTVTITHVRATPGEQRRRHQRRRGCLTRKERRAHRTWA